MRKSLINEEALAEARDLDADIESIYDGIDEKLNPFVVFLEQALDEQLVWLIQTLPEECCVLLEKAKKIIHQRHGRENYRKVLSMRLDGVSPVIPHETLIAIMMDVEHKKMLVSRQAALLDPMLKRVGDADDISISELNQLISLVPPGFYRAELRTLKKTLEQADDGPRR